MEISTQRSPLVGGRNRTKGVSLFCARVTTEKEVTKGNSNGVCFLTEAQASAKDSVVMSTNTFPVTSWDDHSLTAVTEFYADKNGDQASKTSRARSSVYFGWF